MTSVDEIVRDAARSLRAPDEIPVFRTVRRRARRRRAASALAVAAVLVGTTVVAAQSRRSTDHVNVAGKPTSTDARRDVGPNLHDLVGDAPPISLSHTGGYVWTSPVVLPWLPAEFAWSYDLRGRGTAEVDDETAQLIGMQGGYALRMTFSVSEVTGAPILVITASASGPDAGPSPETVVVPNVVGLPEQDATAALGMTRLGVAVVQHGATDEIVLSQDPAPGSRMPQRGVVTLTLRPRE